MGGQGHVEQGKTRNSEGNRSSVICNMESIKIKIVLFLSADDTLSFPLGLWALATWCVFIHAIPAATFALKGRMELTICMRVAT